VADRYAPLIHGPKPSTRADCLAECAGRMPFQVAEELRSLLSAILMKALARGAPVKAHRAEKQDLWHGSSVEGALTDRRL